jgi:acetyl-CoA carboxylase alpha subunit
LGVIDAIVPEPPGGAHSDTGAMIASLKNVLVRNVRELMGQQAAELVAKRYARFRRFGEAETAGENNNAL